MLRAMMEAEVGDDVFGEDPTVNRLQEVCARMSGKPAALFVPTGVMGNQLAIKAHTVPGDEVIVESESHILNYETAAPSVISSVQLFAVEGKDGVMLPEDISKHIRSDEYYFPKTRLICLENTHNRAGGVILPLDNISAVSSLARNRGIKTHLDGARIFNASVETGISLQEYSKYFDSVSFCFSKGLGAPVGSVLCGTSGFIESARKWRKILGGGMRQAGVIASAALFALENNVARLREDHLKARAFAEEISKAGRIAISPGKVHTNIVVFEATGIDKRSFIDEMRSKGVLLSSGSYENIRAVFHLDVTHEETMIAAGRIREMLG